MSDVHQTSNGAGPTEEKVVIIGSGPSGFTAALYAARANLEPLLITGSDYGGQVSITYEIENYPGFPDSLSGPELVDRMKQQAEKFGARVEYDLVTDIATDAYPFLLTTQNGKQYRAEAVIVCTGARPRYLEVPGEQEYMGKGVSYCATCDGFFFSGKDVLVIGGGDSAIEEGLFLTKFATRVRVVHRRDELRASQILQNRARKNDKLDFVWNTVVTEIEGNDAGQVIGVKTRNTQTGEEGYLETDGVFVFVGHIPNNEILTGKFDLDDDGHLITDQRMRTNVPGIMAAGEIMDKIFKQVATSVGQGCSAAMQTVHFLAELEEEGYPGVDVDPRERARITQHESEPLGSW
ncbi:MAG: thioredoxin-disulfide reductase [Caldilineaceae bacterium]|nr:thioredoxin-disulfide reductase [Caldilineaceae bacterium]